MRYAVSLLLLLASTCLTASEADRVKVALALASASVEAEKPQFGLSYSEAAEKALKEGKPLIVWVGIKDTALEEQLFNCIHYHTDTFPGASKGVVVGVPDGSGKLRRVDLPGTPTLTRIRAVLVSTSGMGSPGASPPVYSFSVNC